MQQGAWVEPLADWRAEVIDLGRDHRFAWLWRRPLDWPEDRPWDETHDALFPDDVFAIVEEHQYRDDPGRLCQAVVYLRHPFNHLTGTVWKVQRWQPLDLECGIQCEECGECGTIHDGEWQPLTRAGY